MSQYGSINPSFIVFVIIIFLLNSGNPSRNVNPAVNDRHDRQIQIDKGRFSMLTNATFDSRSTLNFNGSQEVTKEHANFDFALSADRDVALPLYSNASSNLMGTWTSVPADNIGEIDDTSTKQAAFNHFFSRTHGKLSATLDDYALSKQTNGSRIRLELKFTSKKGWTTKEVTLEGVHLTSNGQIFLASDQIDTHGVFFTSLLPLDPVGFADVQQTSREILERRISAGRIPDDNQDECNIMAVAQIHRSQGSIANFNLSEHEYRAHSGVPYKQLQPVAISGRLFSIECKTSLTFSLQGVRIPQLQDRAQQHSVFFILIVMLQIYTIIRQMKETSTPSNLWRVSFWSIASQCLLDGYNSVVFLVCGLALEAAFLPMLVASFLAFLSMALYGMRYLFLIYRMQRQFTAAEETAIPVAGNADDGHALTDGTAVISATNDVEQSVRQLTDGEIERRDLSTLYIRFYFSLLVLLFVSLQVAYLPNTLRDILTGLSLLVVNSYWLPQIYRQAVLGYRKALSMKFVITTSGCRLVPVLYIYGWSTNILLHEPEWYIVWAILGYSWLQILVLAGQSLFGPRFFLPHSKSLRAVHDYHSLPPSDLESTPSGHDSTCAICMYNLDLPDDSANSASAILARRAFMRTPCNHIFHTTCLSEWMERRLKCPICRSILPPD